ncbi:hypothetical protein N9Z06_00905 [Akkermansiaceae bacterium]|nr:hypothetical protein [Akkermansiaceae bacterium]
MSVADKLKRATVYLDPELHKALKISESGCFFARPPVSNIGDDALNC